ncbi:MAG: hypothetical protein IPL54_07975 [Chitinophagaceae bacterium]|nr:hypothetical protein [Chitinophagaceae bacterium]
MLAEKKTCGCPHRWVQ